LGRIPTAGEIAREIGEDLDTVLEAQSSAVAYQARSLDAPAGDGDVTPMDLIGTNHDPGSDWAWHAVAAAFDIMGERERQILQMRFYEDMTQSEIAGILGISQMHVSRLLNRALGKLQAIIDEA
jgi:RNA polymerase sigma-B factor